MRNILMLACRVPSGFTNLEQADVQEVLISHAAESTEKDLKQLTVLSELGSDTLVERPEERSPDVG